jgi:rSAM/selenodomain-associated transferase 1
MVKEPVAGRVKTRLAREVGAVAATSFARRSAAGVIARLSHSRCWQVYLAVGPEAAIASRAWPLSLPRLAQGPGDLGARMQRIMDRLPRGPVVIIGTDIPGIGAAHIRSAFKLLASQDAVFGPAPDGGYWLVGLRRRLRVPRAFSRVRWSTQHALADTRANLDGMRLAEVPTLSDVDEATEFVRFGSLAGRRVLPVVRVALKPGCNA